VREETAVIQHSAETELQNRVTGNSYVRSGYGCNPRNFKVIFV